MQHNERERLKARETETDGKAWCERNRKMKTRAAEDIHDGCVLDMKNVTIFSSRRNAVSFS